MTRNTQIKWLKALVYAGIYGGLLLPLVFVPRVIFPFVFSKLLFYQILIGLTFPAYLVLAWAEPAYRPRWKPLYIAVAGYYLALLLSVIFSVDVARSWWGNQERMNGLFTLLHFFLWLTMATALIKTWVQWKKLLIYEIIISGVMACVSLLQIPFPKLLLFPAGPRVGGLLDNPIYMAAYQIFNLFFIVLLWLKDSSRTTKLWLAVIALLDIGAFFAAQSRGAMLGMVCGVGVFVMVYALFSTNKKAKYTVLSIGTVLAVAYGLMLIFHSAPIIRNSPLSRLTSFTETLDTRLIAWRIGWQSFLERPITGWGLDNFHILFNQHFNPKSMEFGYYETWFDRAHNTMVDVISMTGLLGFLTFVGIWVVFYWSLFRAYRRKLMDLPMFSVLCGLSVGYFIQNLFVFDQPAGFVMSFLMYALAISAAAPGFYPNEPNATVAAKGEAPKFRMVPWYAFGILQVIAVLIVWRTSVMPAYASVLTINSNNYFSTGQYAIAYDYAKRAAEIDTPYLDEQTFLQARNLIGLIDNGAIANNKAPMWKDWHDLVVKITDKHLAIHKVNTHPHFIYARFLQAFSTLVPEDAQKALDQYNEAIKTSPTRQQLYYSLGRFYLERGMKQEGLDVLNQALKLNPNVGESHWYVGLAMMFDQQQFVEGAKEIAASQTVKKPYGMQDAREAVAFANAYRVLNDREGFKKLMEIMPTLPGGSVDIYLEVAKNAELLDLIPERNLILGALQQAQPTLIPRLAPLQSGAATTIADAFRLTEDTIVTNITTPATSSESTGPKVQGPRK